MSKKVKGKYSRSEKLHPTLYKMSQKSSHTGGKPLVPHINDENVMVTQKVRKAQDSKR